MLGHTMIERQGGWLALIPYDTFVFLGTFTFISMIIGIQGDVASNVAEQEREIHSIVYLKTHLLGVLETDDARSGQTLSQEEMELCMQDPELHESLAAFGTDLGGLYYVLDGIFQGKESLLPEESRSATTEPPAHLAFSELRRVVLQLRGSNPARLVDILALHGYLRNGVYWSGWPHSLRVRPRSAPHCDREPRKSGACISCHA